jgi:hypothetical protein
MKNLETFKSLVAKKSLEFIKIKLDQVPAVMGSDVFKTYKVLDRGNTKLATNILSFSLPPVITCGGMRCDGCYDVRSLRYKSVKAKRLANLSMALHNMETLEQLIVKQITNSRTCEYVRIHVGGDFYSEEYVAMWERIVDAIAIVKPNVKFYTYTKTSFGDRLTAKGINVVKSITDDKEMNYGSLEYVRDLAKKHNGVVCPATISKVEDGFCGNKCKACMCKRDVFFKIH